MRPDTPSDPPRRLAPLPSGPAAYTDEGEGPAVLCLHGCPGSVRDFRWLAPAMSDHLRVLRVDLPGFGQTPRTTWPAADAASRARFVVALADALGLDRFAVLGHSAGGPPALAVAADYPARVTALGQIATPGVRPHQELRNHPRAHWITPWLELPGIGRPLTGLIRHAFERSGFPRNLPDDAIRQSMQVVRTFDWPGQRARLQRVRCPTLVAWTTDDHFVEAAIGDELARLAPEGPRLRFEEGGHYLQKTRSVEIGSAMATLLSD